MQNRENRFFVKKGESDGASLKLRLSPSSGTAAVSGVSFSTECARVFGTEADREFIEAATVVRRQQPFAHVTEAYLDSLAKGYPFILFPHQKENIAAMLNRFGGRGVFGDQVGLGKTVEALTCAHAMFECGAIRNALIVVPEKTKDGWISEIRTKFPDVFDIRSDGGFEEALTRISRDAHGSSQTGYPLYLITSNQLEKNAREANGLSLKLRAKRSYDPENKDYELSREEELFIAGCENNRDGSYPNYFKILKRSNYLGMTKARLAECVRLLRDGYFGNFFVNELPSALGYNELATISKDSEKAPTKVLRRYGFDMSFDEMLTEMERAVASGELPTFPLHSFSRAKQVLLIALIDDMRQTISTLAKSVRIIDPDARLSELETIARKLKLQLRMKDAEAERIEKKSEMNRGAHLIDLLIVDEIHNFYAEDGCQEDTDDRRRQAIEFLSKTADSKYRILISATPVRTRLEDVYELISLADPERLGNDPRGGEDYFYENIFLLKGGREQKDKLISIIEGEETRENFFGLVNSFFTRRRINQVKDDMSVCYSEDEMSREQRAVATERTLSEIEAQRGELESFIADGLMSDIHNKRTDMLYRGRYVRGGNAPTEAQAQIRSYLADGRIPGDRGGNKRRHVKAAINYVLLMRSHELTEALSMETDGYRRAEIIRTLREYHSRISWERPSKKSILVDLHPECDTPTAAITDPGQRSRRIEGAVAELFSVFEKIFVSKNGKKSVDTDAFAAACESMLTLPSSVGRDSLEYLEPFADYLANDYTLVHISPDGVGGARGNIRFRAASHPEIQMRGRKIEVNPDMSWILAQSDESGADVEPEPRPVVIIDESWQAGVNLQKFGLIVFTSMDNKEGRLLSPVDVEQWIGRIHRTGQVRTCRVIALLDSYVAGNKGVTRGGNGYKAFLRWYWELLSDESGFAIYGDNTPDVAFLQPIVADWIRRELRRGERAGLCGSPDGFGDFSELAEAYYDFERSGGNRVVPLTNAVADIRRSIGDFAQ